MTYTGTALIVLLVVNAAYPTFAEYPVELPDPMLMNGLPVRTPEEWVLRRKELRDVLLRWQYGQAPPVPEIHAVATVSDEVQLPGLEKPVRKVMTTLRFGPDGALEMQACCWLPASSGEPVPVVLAIEPVWWEDPFVKNGILQRILERGYGFAGFDHNALASYEEPTLRAAQDVYPGYDWGVVAVAAWGCSLTLNWLETLPEVNADRVAVWGHSRRGKSALLAGALDERFGAVLPHMSGMGGSALYRVRGKGAQRIDQLLERYWLHESLFGFHDREETLPFDQHWLYALVAPRPLYIHAGLRDAWGNPDGEQAAVAAAAPVYAWLGQPENLQIGLVDAGHVDPNGADGGPSWEAALDFLDARFSPPKPSVKDILVGVSYFAGWWEPLPNKWHDGEGRDWRPRFPERVPLLGAYNTQEVMDREIVAASEHGVDFFAILWYYNPPGVEREPNSRFLDRGLEGFMASPEAHRMKFFIEFCNHPPYEVETDDAWQACVDYWTDCIAHPSYLRVDGKPVFKVHGGHYFFQQNGQDSKRCHDRLNQLRDAVRARGLGELLIGCGVAAHESVGPDHFAAQLFDFTGTYMDLPPLPKQEKDYPFAQLDAFICEGRLRHINDAVPYMPFVGAGWSPHPWPDPRACFTLPERGEWRKALEQVAADLAQHERLGLPGKKAFTIYAWNEFGEGGFVAPVQADPYMKLEVIRDVFER